MQVAFLENKISSGTSNKKMVHNTTWICVLGVFFKFGCRLRRGNDWAVFLTDSLDTLNGT